MDERTVRRRRTVKIVVLCIAVWIGLGIAAQIYHLTRPPQTAETLAPPGYDERWCGSDEVAPQDFTKFKGTDFRYEFHTGCFARVTMPQEWGRFRIQADDAASRRDGWLALWCATEGAPGGPYALGKKFSFPPCTSTYLMQGYGTARFFKLQ
jgi:hypothetical protein